MSKSSVLQFEFFHAKGSTPDDVLSDALDRFSERLEAMIVSGEPMTSTGIKTVMRILDSNDCVKNAVQEILTAQKFIDGWHCGNYSKKNWLVKHLAGYRLGKCVTERSRLRRLIHEYACTYVARAIKGNERIGIQTLDFTFRPAERNELSELLQAVRTMEYFWLFIFPSNDLFATEYEESLALFN